MLQVWQGKYKLHAHELYQLVAAVRQLVFCRQTIIPRKIGRNQCECVFRSNTSRGRTWSIWRHSHRHGKIVQLNTYVFRTTPFLTVNRSTTTTTATSIYTTEALWTDLSCDLIVSLNTNVQIRQELCRHVIDISVSSFVSHEFKCY